MTISTIIAIAGAVAAAAAAVAGVIAGIRARKEQAAHVERIRSEEHDAAIRRIIESRRNSNITYPQPQTTTQIITVPTPVPVTTYTPPTVYNQTPPNTQQVALPNPDYSQPPQNYNQNYQTYQPPVYPTYQEPVYPGERMIAEMNRRNLLSRMQSMYNNNIGYYDPRNVPYAYAS